MRFNKNFIIIITLTVAFNLNSKDKQQEIEYLFREYIDTINIDKEKGELIFNKIKSIDSNSREAIVINAMLSKDSEKEILILNKIIEKNPKYYFAYTVRGFHYFMIENDSFAEKDFKTAIKLNSNFPKSYSSLAMLKMYSNDCNSAIKLFNTAIKLKDKDPMTYFLNGQCLKNNGDIDSAFKNFKKTLEINPKEKIAYFELGEILYNKLLYSEALGRYIRTGLDYDNPWWIKYFFLLILLWVILTPFVILYIFFLFFKRLFIV